MPAAETIPTDTGVVLDPDAVASLRAAVLILARRLRYQVVGEGLTPSETAVLGRLQRGPTTPGCLARSEHVQPPSMTRVLERLEARDLVRRTPHAEDRRQVLVELTDHGRDQLDRTRQARTAWLSDQLDRLDPADLQSVLAVAPALLRLAELP